MRTNQDFGHLMVEYKYQKKKMILVVLTQCGDADVLSRMRVGQVWFVSDESP